MQVEKDIQRTAKRNTIRELTRLVLAFLLCLFLLALYQHLRLYIAGVLESVMNKSLFYLWLHHIGFTALISLIIVFPFNILERKKPKLGYIITRLGLIITLIIEIFLVEFYVQNYEIFGLTTFDQANFSALFFKVLPVLILACPIIIITFYQFHKVMARSYQLISRMYPFTIILFGLFLATFFSAKKPINQNKTQHLIGSLLYDTFDFNSYNGELEYPLMKSRESVDVLSSKFSLTKEKPNLVFLIVEGLGKDFVGANAAYKDFSPFLNKLSQKSLHWTNFLSNTSESSAALPSIIGSLPFGNSGFNNLENTPERNTLFGVLKTNDYYTSFNYGGNSALNQLDRFLAEEHVDHILDRTSFDLGYRLQESDGAGISLGYPDKALFKKWNTDFIDKETPRLDVFQTLSTQKPFLIPDAETYVAKVNQILKRTKVAKHQRKFLSKNKKLLASFLYTDEALKAFFVNNQEKRFFKNTIFVLVGTHNVAHLPGSAALERYRVPLMIYSPMLKSPEEIKTLTSQVDIAPMLLELLDKDHTMEVPSKVAWLGNPTSSNAIFTTSKKIPLFRSKGNIEDFILGDHLYAAGTIYKMDKQLKLHETSVEPEIEEKIKSSFKSFKAINKYVTTNNKVLPNDFIIYPKHKENFTKQEMVWINSVFSGSNFDNAYQTARSLAFKKKNEKALLLCNYILSKVPRHTDTEILMGRIYAWNGEYNSARDILKNVIHKYPNYSDAYAALLDVYFWSDQNEEILKLIDQIEHLKITDEEVRKRVSRAFKKVTERKERKRWEEKNNQLTTLEFDDEF